MDKIKLTILQSDIIWEQKAANIENYDRLLAQTTETDVIVLPEMFTTGFTMHPEHLKETMDGPSVSWMKDTAREKNAAVTGTLIIEDENKHYNRCLWVFPDGTVKHYDKRHLFSMGDESKYYAAGSQRLVVDFRGWRFCPLICYDLRFPIWSRNNDNYDVLLYLTNWPSSRHYVWKSLMVARAIENQAYCVGVNRIGFDGEDTAYEGDSALIDPKGFATFIGDHEKAETFQISYKELHQFRESFPVLKDQDKIIFQEKTHLNPMP